jgi:putative PIN family toxin of toxin-antitoxin system
MASYPPKVVFDCNLFVQMMLNPHGTAATCKELVEQGRVVLFVSTHVLAEVAEVLARPKFTQLVPGLTTERIENFVTEIAAISVPILNVPEEFHYDRDPEDEPYINLAVVAAAQYIVSLDRDLLDLMDPTTTDGVSFRDAIQV